RSHWYPRQDCSAERGQPQGIALPPHLLALVPLLALRCQTRLLHAGISPDNDRERQPNKYGITDEAVDNEQRSHRHLWRGAEGQNERAHEHVHRSPKYHRTCKDRAAQECDLRGSQDEDCRDNEGYHKMNEQSEKRRSKPTSEGCRP